MQASSNFFSLLNGGFIFCEEVNTADFCGLSFDIAFSIHLGELQSREGVDGHGVKSIHSSTSRTHKSIHESECDSLGSHGVKSIHSSSSRTHRSIHESGCDAFGSHCVKYIHSPSSRTHKSIHESECDAFGSHGVKSIHESECDTLADKISLLALVTNGMQYGDDVLRLRVTSDVDEPGDKGV